ncbi:MAG TPA: isoprenylcysteine carboxylmethyltransferase family protein [Candidatus Bathyarchaeia archaeon]|nr:isoprenylcysteine carboxylmethyltransferase family protein [Candidatus Bathyarchaeia archaeon]
MLFSTYWECERYWVFPAGLAIFAAGLGIRVWAQMHLHYRLKERKVLTTTGPYRIVRNPIYIANTLIMISASVLSELLWFTPFMLLWCAVLYSLVVRHEEKHLTSKYGQAYVDYVRQVPRWIPGIPDCLKVASPHVRHFMLRSLGAEMYCFLYIIPFVLKEVVSDLHTPL